MATLTVPYRSYELPWTPSPEERERLRRILIICFAFVALLSILLPLLPLPEKTQQEIETVPPRLAKLVLERKAPPPPPPPPPPKVEQAPKPLDTKPVPQTKPQAKPVEDARRKASQAGLLPFQEQLAALRDNSVLDKAATTKNLSGKVGETTSSERSLITSKVGQNSGGINTAALSRGYGSGAGSLTGHTTTQVSSSTLAAQQADDGVRRGSGSTKAARSREEIELVFDRNKGAIYALYSRALRDKPELKGKVVLELTIASSGEITQCRVVSSELNDPDLERKLVARVKSFRFEAREVESITTTKPIDFFPA
jgi:periplasmic protein TonB